MAAILSRPQCVKVCYITGTLYSSMSRWGLTDWDEVTHICVSKLPYRYHFIIRLCLIIIIVRYMSFIFQLCACGQFSFNRSVWILVSWNVKVDFGILFWVWWWPVTSHISICFSSCVAHCLKLLLHMHPVSWQILTFILLYFVESVVWVWSLGSIYYRVMYV